MIFADKLRTARSIAGLTQVELADRLGVPQSTVGRWETGVMPGVDWLPKIAHALGCDVADLVPD